MGALDRLDWAAGLAVDCYGVRVGVRVSDASLLPRVTARLPPGFTISGRELVDVLYSVRGGGTIEGTNLRRFHLVYAGATQCERTLDEETALATFESVVRFDVATLAAQYVFVHAGVVSWRDLAIVIPGASTHGKSTLVEALVRAGATYYSDEFAVIDDGGQVHPFAKPLTLRSETGEVRQVAPAEIGAIGRTPQPIGLIVATRFEPGGVWRPRRLQAGEALLELLGHTVRARLAPAQTLRTLARVVESCVTLVGPRGEAATVAHDLLDTLDEVSSASEREAPAVREVRRPSDRSEVL